MKTKRDPGSRPAVSNGWRGRSADSSVSRQSDAKPGAITASRFTPSRAAAKLSAAGASVYPWITPGDPSGGKMHRLIALFATTEYEVDRVLALARETNREKRVL